MAQERNGPATVIAQEGNQLRVEHKGKQLTVPMQGFPPAFRLRPGARVILVDEPSGLVARPLVRTVVSRLSRETLQRRGSVEIEGRRLEMQESTVVEEPPKAEERPSDEYVLWVVERGAGEPADQVIAARRRR